MARTEDMIIWQGDHEYRVYYQVHGKFRRSTRHSPGESPFIEIHGVDCLNPDGWVEEGLQEFDEGRAQEQITTELYQQYLRDPVM